MHAVIQRVKDSWGGTPWPFTKKPILIGGMAMEYYGMRKAGADIDLVICNEDYQALAKQFPDKRKDLYGDMGLVIGIFEIWRSIALLDYDFYLKDAVCEKDVLVVSVDRLLWMRVCAMDVEKYRKDLELMRQYYRSRYPNAAYVKEMQSHERSYRKMKGAVFGGRYQDE
ncbi:MAG: hypothetical protein JW811_03930 [Clostridiales bacterium]|nr:hypothetical protein [Clostridiales bacterium]